MSGDAEQDYFADGIVEDIITALSRFKSFAVVARNSTFVYKGRAVDVRQVAKELGVRYVLEGSVRRSGDRFASPRSSSTERSGRISGRRSSMAPSTTSSTSRTDHESVIGLVEPQIRKAEIERARRKPPESLDAWDLYVQALPLVYAQTCPPIRMRLSCSIVPSLSRPIMHRRLPLPPGLMRKERALGE